MKKKISILGSTGSIGLTTLKIVEKKNNYLNINFLTANKNYKLICKQIIKYKPKYFIIKNSFVYERVKKRFKKNKVKILNDYKLLEKTNSDIIISAIWYKGLVQH